MVLQAGVPVGGDQGQETWAQQLGARVWGFPEHERPEVWDSGSCLVDQGAESGRHQGSLGRDRGVYCCPLVWFLAFAGQGPSFQEVPLDSGRALGIACQRAGLEEHRMIQGEDICSEFRIGCDVQGGSSGRGDGLGSHLFVVKEGSGIQVSFPGQGHPVDQCVVMEILGVLEELGEYFELLHKGTFRSKEDSEEDAGMVHPFEQRHPIHGRIQVQLS
jgi:hypothetical protein